MGLTAPISIPLTPTTSFSCLYRILTEWKNVDQVERWLVSHGFDYTIFTGNGAWHGARENSMAIELAAVAKEGAVSAAVAIKEMNDQDSVLLQELPVLSMFL